MSDFIVKLVVKNGHLLRAIRAKFGTSAELSRNSGVSQQAIAGLLSMRLSPLLKNGDWSLTAYNISSALHMEPEELWPAHIAKMKLLRNEAELDMSIGDVQAIAEGPNFEWSKHTLEKWMSKTMPRRAEALRLHADGATLEDIGKTIGVTRERARQIVLHGARDVRKAAKLDGVTSVHEMRTPK